MNLVEVTLAESVLRLGREADQRSAEFERDVRIPADVYDRAARLGLFRQLVPDELGGLGRSPREWFRLGLSLAACEASLGWVVTQGAAAMGWLGAGGDPTWVDEVLRDPQMATASSIAGAGTLQPDSGDYLFQGTWTFASGCDGATWLGGLAAVAAPNGQPPDRRWALVPAGRAEIERSWNPLGLRGTGSHTIVVPPQRIPAAWTFSTFQPSPYRTGPYATLVGNGNWPIATSVAATQLGIARRSLDEITALLHLKPSGPGLPPLATTESAQRALMEAEGLWAAATAGVESGLDKLWDAANGDPSLGASLRTGLLTANVTANRLAVRVVDTACELAGTSFTPAEHRLNRCLRDVSMLRGHISANAAALQHAGRVHMGMEPSHQLV